MFFSLDKNACQERKAVYVFKLYLDWNNRDVVYKIGLTRREDVGKRLMEVLGSFYEIYRYVPRCTVLRFSSCQDADVAENVLHRLFKEWKIAFNEKFSGSSEFFDIDEDLLLITYDRIVKGII